MKPSKTTFLVVNLVYFAVVLLILIESLTFTEQGGVVPLVVGFPTLGMLFMALGVQLFPVLNQTLIPGKTFEEAMLDVAPWSKATPIIGWIGGLFILIFLLGFKISIPLYTFAILKLYGNISWKKSATMAIALWFLVYVSFDILLHKSLFEGVLFEATLPLL
ncbi:MAG: hypothetical protein ACE5JU_20885 [Candidatus Binatia bacterium]